MWAEYFDHVWCKNKQQKNLRDVARQLPYIYITIDLFEMMTYCIANVKPIDLCQITWEIVWKHQDFF